MNGKVEDYDRICMPVGWARHPRFEALVQKVGYEGLGIFLTLQDFVAEHGTDDMVMRFPDEGFGGLASVAHSFRCEESKLREVVEVASFLDLVEREGEFLSFRRASKFRRGPRTEPEKFSTKPGEKSSTGFSTNGNALHVVCNAGSPGAEIQAKRLEIPPEESASALNAMPPEEILEGFDCTRSRFLDELGFSPGDAFKVMDRESMENACGTLKFDAESRKKISELIERCGEKLVHGAFRAYIHQSRPNSPLRAKQPIQRVKTFLGCFSEKVSLYKDVMAGGSSALDRFVRVPVSSSDELLPEGPVEPREYLEPAPVPKRDQSDMRRRLGLGEEKPSAQDFKPGWFDDPGKPAAQYAIEARMVSEREEEESFALVMQQIEENGSMPIESKGKEIIN